MEKRALLAVVLSLLVLFIYQYFTYKEMEVPVDEETQQSDTVEPQDIRNCYVFELSPSI